MKNLILFVFISISVHSLAQKNSGAPVTAADSLAMLKEFQKEMLKAIEEEFKPSATVKADRLEDHSLPQELSDAKAKELTKLFTSSFFFRPSPFSGETSQILVEFDNFFFPGPDMVQYNVKSLKALDRSNKDHLLADPNNSSDRWSSITYGGQTFLKLKDTFQNKITKVEAEISVRTPLKLNIAKLDKSQINKPFVIGSTTGRLLKIENDFASIWIDTSYENFQLIPFNINGQPLDVNSNTSFAFEPEKDIIKSLGLPKDLSSGSLMYIKVNGVIARVDVYELVKSMDTKNKITIFPKPVLINGSGNVTNEQYQNLLPKDFSNLIAIDSSKLKDKKQVQIIKVVNEWDKSITYRLQFGLPSDKLLLRYAQTSFQNLKFYNKKKLVKESETDGFYDSEKCEMYCTPQNEDYNPLEYDEVEGFIIVKYPGKISTNTYKRADEKAGITAITGNKLTLNRDVLAEVEDILSSSSLQALRVFGKSSVFPLKKDSYSSTEYKNEKSVEHQFYLGNITSVQLDIPADWTEIRFPFKVSRPAEKATKKK